MNALPILATSFFSICAAFSVPRNSNLPYSSSSPAKRHLDHGSRDSTILSSSISSNEELLPGISAINNANDDISAKLENLRETSYFRLYSVDILASCEYMPQELFECYSETCEVYPIDEEEVCLSSCLKCIYISWIDGQQNPANFTMFVLVV